MFVASIVKIRTLNKDVLDSEWTLTSRSGMTRVLKGST